MQSTFFFVFLLLIMLLVLSNPSHKRAIFSLRSFIVLVPTLVNFEFIFCLWMREVCKFICLHADIQFSSNICWKTVVSPNGFSSVQFSHSVMSNYLRPHEPQHTRPPCPSPIPGVHPNSRRLSPWCHPATSSSVVPFSSCPQTLPASNFTQVFSNESALHNRWQKYWSFSFNIRPSSEHTKTDVL